MRKNNYGGSSGDQCERRMLTIMMAMLVEGDDLQRCQVCMFLDRIFSFVKDLNDHQMLMFLALN